MGSILDPYTDEIIASYTAGIAGSQIARRYAVHETTVYRFLRKRGVSIRSRPRKDLPTKEIINAYEAGLPVSKIAAILNVCPATIYQQIHTYNQSIVRFNVNTWEFYIRLYRFVERSIQENGFSPTLHRMAAQFDKGTSTIYYHIQRMVELGYFCWECRMVRLTDKQFVWYVMEAK